MQHRFSRPEATQIIAHLAHLAFPILPCRANGLNIDGDVFVHGGNGYQGSTADPYLKDTWLIPQDQCASPMRHKCSSDSRCIEERLVTRASAMKASLVMDSNAPFLSHQVQSRLSDHLCQYQNHPFPLLLNLLVVILKRRQQQRPLHRNPLLGIRRSSLPCVLLLNLCKLRP